jgi:EmrB/QacA subfamily drug resistance transporter
VPGPLVEATRKYRWMLLLVSGAAFLDFLDVTVVNLAFPALRRDFSGVPVSNLTWVITGYAVMFAALLAAAGRLADVIGRRRMFLSGVALFTLASLASALAPSFGALVAARFVQGVGAATILPSGLAIVLGETPPERRAAAIGVWGAAAGAAAAFGPTVGGLLVHLIDWRAVFIINVPAGALILIGGRRTIREQRGEDRRIPDLLGTAAITAGIGLLVLGVTKGTDWGWSSPATLTSVLAGLLLVALTVSRSRRHRAPAIETRLWRARPFAVANLASLFYGASAYAAMLVSVLFLVAGWHYSELRAGLAMSPGAVTGAIAAAVTGRVADRRGPRLAVVAGSVLSCAVCLYLVAVLTGQQSFLAVWLPANTLNGIAMGMTAVGLSSTAAAAVPSTRFAAATGLSMTARQCGAALGVAAVAAILQAELAHGISGYIDAYLFCAVTAACSAAVGLTISIRTARATPATKAPRPAASQALGL